jgi:serine beta-lactamase-like protein LACTB
VVSCRAMRVPSCSRFVPVLASVIVVAVAAVPGQSAPAQTAPAWTAAVVEAIEARVRSDEIPGLSCAIGVGAEIPFRRGFGLADLENDVKATEATVYRLGSISKPITAVAVMQLVEAGQLDLDRNVHEIVSEWPEKQWPVTTRLLLSHLAGIRHYRRGEEESVVHFATQVEGLMRFAQDPLLHEPGTKYSYSTYGYNLIAAVVEKVAKKPFAEVVRERIAVPSRATTLQDDDIRRIIRGRAQGYVRVDGKLQNSELMDSSYKLGGGGLCCSAEDLVRFAQALLAGTLVKKETLEQMWTPAKLRDGTAIDYALGFGVGKDGTRAVVSHSGAQSRVSTMLYILPEQQVTVVLLCNLERTRLQPLAQAIARLVAPL